MNRLLAGVALAALTVTQGATGATVLTGQAGASGGSTHVPLVAFAKTASDAGVAEIQVTDGNTLTKAAIAVSVGKADIAVLPIAVLNLLNKGVGPYKKMGKEKSQAIKSNLRQLFGYKAGFYTFVTFADSGINSLADIKGKKVLVGPPSGAASVNSMAILKAATGYEGGKDYEAIKMGWGAVQQAFIDKKVDVIVRPGPWPNALFSQLVSSGDLRVFGMSETLSKVKRAGLKPAKVATSLLGKGFVFTNESGGEVSQMSYMMSFNVNKDMTDEMAYNVTKAFFDRYDHAMKAAAWMPGLEINKVVTGLESVGGKIHPGALRYYDEAGIAVPASLR
ncbi:MAG: TAXI family TRAP transporter solute-binding subunit [Pseudomonadota bacterium]